MRACAVLIFLTEALRHRDQGNADITRVRSARTGKAERREEKRREEKRREEQKSKQLPSQFLSVNV
jgi:hypothetical protein